jgi:DNA-binding transcriptional MerR regulator
MGLLSSRRSINGYREYPDWAPGRVRLVQRALAVGFALDELAQILAIRQRGGAPCRRVRALAATKLQAMDQQLRDLRALRGELRALIAAWDERLAKTGKDQRAWLLESWASEPAAGRQLRPSTIRGRRAMSRPREGPGGPGSPVE